MPFTDLTTLRAQTGGLDFIVKQIVDKFLETVPSVIVEMREQLAAGNFEDLGKNAHKLKSTTAHLGIADVQEPLLQLERIWKENANHAKANGAMESVSAIMEAAFVELRNAVG